MPYIGEINSEDAFEDQAKLFFCPEDKDPYPVGYGSYWHNVPFTSYALNGCYAPGSGRRPEIKLGPAGRYRTTQIQAASSCMLMTETSYSHQIYDAEHPNVLSLGLIMSGHHRQTSGFYHDSSINILYVDCHVDNTKGQKCDPVIPCWDVEQYAFWPDLTLPNAMEDASLWGPGYK